MSSSKTRADSTTNAPGDSKHAQNVSFQAVFETVRTLRGPKGCPWDKEQTHISLVPFAIEETYELAQAIEAGDDLHFKDELGDVLFQVLLHASMAEERGAFTLKDVMDNLNEKLIRRHPHVFANEKMEDMATIYKRWDEIKAEEKKGKALPALEVTPMAALQRAHKIGAKTKKLNFDWNHASEVKEKLHEELQEIESAIEENDPEKINEEMGDFLFSAAQWARHLKLDPEASLRAANEKFLGRFNSMIEMVRLDNRHFSELSQDEKNEYWLKIKKLEKS